MIARRLSRVLAGTFAVVLLAFPAFAQIDNTAPEVQPNNYPPALPARKGPTPSLVFERLGEIALPGPLGIATSRVEGDRVLVPVAAGWASVVPEADATPTIIADVTQVETPEWIESSDGRRRFRTTQEGLVEAQRRRGKGRWRKSWRVIAPNSIMAPPVLLGARLCYAGLDDRVTCLRASNGHRLWTVDLGDRLSRRLTCWPRCGDEESAELVLAVPDDGASVVALDAYDGRRVATYELPATHHFASSALVVDRDRIAIARKGYGDEEAALVLLRLAAPPPPKPAGTVPYNEAPPASAGASRR